jgi:hypothetical protein
MYCILLNAKVSKKRKIGLDSQPLVGYVKNKINNDLIVSFLLTLNGIEEVAVIPTSVYNYIADIKGDENRTRKG